MVVLEHHQIVLVEVRKDILIKLRVSEPVTLCRKCGYVRIYLDRRDKVPYEYRTKERHNCDCSSVFECIYCSGLCFYDRRVLAPNGRRIKLDPETGRHHICTKKK